MPAAIATTTSPALPLEVVTQIVSYLSAKHRYDVTDQKTLRAFTLVSRTWYAAATGPLYQNPSISGRNYDKFVATVCPSINTHVRKNGLAELVRTLDLGRLIHHGSKSLTARLLGRVKSSLEVFVAPQATFGINALAALSRCFNLVHLDLSLVSEQIPPWNLQRSLLPLKKLEYLGYPRSGVTEVEPFLDSIPPRVQELLVFGGLSDGTTSRPLKDRFSNIIQPSLTRLTIGNCPRLTSHGVRAILEFYSRSLESLNIEKHMETLRHEPLDGILAFLKSLRHLTIPVDYITHHFFWADSGRSRDNPYPLETIKLDCFWPAYNQVEAINSDLIWDAVADGAFGRLRRVILDRTLELPVVTGLGENSEELNQLLKALAREDGQGGRYSEDQAGVWISGS